MRDQLRRRLTELEAELQRGEQMLADLRARETDLQQNMLRIAGAIQVLREVLDDAANAPNADTSPKSDGVSSTTM